MDNYFCSHIIELNYQPQFTLELGLLNITSESIHTLTRCSLDKPPSCSQCFMIIIEVELSSQITPTSTGGVSVVVLYNPLSVLSRSRGFLCYLELYGVRHLQTVFQLIILNCGSDHGDVLMGEAVV